MCPTGNLPDAGAQALLFTRFKIKQASRASSWSDVFVEGNRSTQITLQHDSHTASAVDLSHSYISQEVRHRAERAAQAAIARREEELTKAEIQRRDVLRFNHCSESSKVLQNKNIEHRCKCGGKWSNGLPGFKAHEKNNKTHALHFPDTHWQRFYDAQIVAIPEAAPHAVGAIVIPGGAGASEGLYVNNSAETNDPELIYANINGMVGHFSSDELAQLLEENLQAQEQDELLAASIVQSQVAQAAADLPAHD